MSAPLAAATLLVPTFTFSFALSAFARSSWATVAQVDFGESRPAFSNACRRMPPILPAPRNATFFPAKTFAIIFLGTYSRLNHSGHRFHGERLTLQLHPIPCSRYHLAQSPRRLPLQ